MSLHPIALLFAIAAIAAMPAHAQAPKKWPTAPGKTPAHEQPAAPAEAQDAVVAVVGKVELRDSELMAELNRQIPLVYYHQKVPQGKLDDLRRKALDKLVEKTLIFLDAEERQIAVGEDEMRATFEQTLAASGEEFKDVSPAKFEQLFAQFKPLVRRRLLLDKNEARFRDSVPKPDDDKLRAVYERMSKESPDALMTPPEARLRHIFVGVDPAADEAQVAEKDAKIEAVKQALAAGKDFAVVAKQYSEDEFAEKGGDLGMVVKGKFKTRQLDDAAFVLQPGQRTEVIRTIYGYHVLQCEEVVPQRLRTIEETRPLLEEWFSTEHYRQRRTAWLTEVREKFGVKILAADLVATPAAAEGAAPGKPAATEPGKRD